MDTVPISKSRKFIEGVLKNFRKDTADTDINNPTRNEERYRPYEGMVVRKIFVERLPFGIPISDTSKRLNNTLTRLTNKLHHLTRPEVIKRNLFFKPGDSVKAFLFSDNERFLRQLPYLNDVEFIMLPYYGTDSVDMVLVTKDVFSLGGAIGSLGLQKSDAQIREDNIKGSGNAGIIYTLYDAKRRGKLALGGEFVQRNIGGSFINGRLGYQSFYNTFGGPQEENYYYVNLAKPMVNRFMRWTYEFDFSLNKTQNRYFSDSVYKADYQYNFYNIDAWVGYNIHAKKFDNNDEKNKLRKLVGLRVIEKQTQRVPEKFNQFKNWQFADISGVLASATFYRQNFYKSKFIYGFGRNEDIPEGLTMSVTSGFTIMEKEKRPFVGFNYQRYGYNKRKNYLSYTLRGEGFLNRKSIEDINVLVSLEYFDRLKRIGSRWNQRFFLNVDMANQINSRLNQPLYLNSQFGLPEYGYSSKGGDFRATIKTESVFFSPWQIAAFKFAPLLFTNVSVFSPLDFKAKVYTAVGAGLRTRNESFVFGTIELKGFFFPQTNFRGEKFAFDISTNLIFKYQSDFIKKPDFIQIN